jgi:hypothetical protein
MVTPNLTPDKETGIGEWTEQRFVNALKYGTVENQKSLRFPMVPFILSPAIRKQKQSMHI